MTPTQVKDEPRVQFEAEKDAYYLLVMTGRYFTSWFFNSLHIFFLDPDVPSRKEAKYEVKHWLIGNIPDGDVKKGDILADYRGSGPPKGSGLHRYVFLVYKQNGKIAYEEKRIPSK